MYKKSLPLFLIVLISFSGVLSQNINSDGTEDIKHIDVKSGQTINDFIDINKPRLDQVNINPGQVPEGDYMGRSIFTNDGLRVLLTNRETNDLTVYDWQSMDVITNVSIGEYPYGIAVTDDYAIVGCMFSDQVKVVDLNTYAVVGSFDTGEQPVCVKVSRDGTRAYVSCDIDNVCEVIDLVTMTKLSPINNFPVALQTISWVTGNGRNYFTYSEFEVSPDGHHLIVANNNDTIFFISTSTGLVDDYITGVQNCFTIGLSGNDSILVALTKTNPAVVHQIDLPSRTIIDSVIITGSTISTNGVGVNYDGSKAYIGISNNSSAIVRFVSSDFVVFTSTYTAFWIGTSPDHSLAVSGQYRFSIIDFNTESVLGQWIGNSQSSGAVSPVGNRAAGFDPLRYEGLYFYDYTIPNTPNYLGKRAAGNDPEGDTPYRVAITADGLKAVVTNTLSDNITIIDIVNHQVDTIIELGDKTNSVGITSDSHWAVLGGFNSNNVKIIDLLTNDFVANIPTSGDRPDIVSIAPDDLHAYIGNVKTNAVSVISLNGALSTEVAYVPCGVIGISWAGYGVRSDVRVGPYGNTVLVAASFDDQVKVFDTQTNTIVSTLAVGDFPLQCAFNNTGEYAVVTNMNDDTYSLIRIDGAASYVINTFATGDAPARCTYDDINNEFLIGNMTSKTIAHINPNVGNTTGIDYYSSFGALIQIIVDELGVPIVLTQSTATEPGHLHRGSDVIVLPAVPSYFDYNPSVNKAVVVMPGPDLVTIVEWTTTGQYEIFNLSLSDDDLFFCENSPNPFSEKTGISFNIPEDGIVDLSVFDKDGRMIKKLVNEFMKKGEHQIIWDASQISAGIYFCNLKCNNNIKSCKMICIP